MNGLDVKLFYAINGGPHPHLLNEVMKLASVLGNKGLIFAVGMLALFLFGKGARREAATVGFMGMVLAIGAGELLKHLINRPRPYVALPTGTVHLLAHYSGSSFPSGHTTIAFAVAVALGSRMRGWFWPLLAFAALIGFSRIYLGDHYPTDVLGGIIVGTLMGGAALYLQRFLRPAEASKSST